jgi:hypothetical protein
MAYSLSCASIMLLLEFLIYFGVQYRSPSFLTFRYRYGLGKHNLIATISKSDSVNFESFRIIGITYKYSSSVHCHVLDVTFATSVSMCVFPVSSVLPHHVYFSGKFCPPARLVQHRSAGKFELRLLLITFIP